MAVELNVVSETSTAPLSGPASPPQLTTARYISEHVVTLCLSIMYNTKTCACWFDPRPEITSQTGSGGISR